MIETLINILGIGALIVVAFWYITGVLNTDTDVKVAKSEPKKVAKTESKPEPKLKLPGDQILKPFHREEIRQEVTEMVNARKHNIRIYESDGGVLDASFKDIEAFTTKTTLNFTKRKIGKLYKEVKAKKKARRVTVTGPRTELKHLLGKEFKIKCQITKETNYGRRLIKGIKFGDFSVDHAWMKTRELKHLKPGNNEFKVTVIKYQNANTGSDKYGFKIAA